MQVPTPCISNDNNGREDLTVERKATIKALKINT